jgi:nicotinamide-nucleotide amidase
MNASIIAVGSEMLGPTRLDTNSLKITAVLERYGVSLIGKSIVGDSIEALRDEIDHALSHSDLLITSGGLGPTLDDLTREALALALGLEVETDDAIVQKIAARFTTRNMVMPEVNKRQAVVFRGQRTLDNERGTAPGFHLEVERNGTRKHIWVFPGVPHELAWMADTYLAPWLQSAGGAARYSRAIKIAGMTESAVEEKLAPFYEAHRDEAVTILATGGQIEIHLSATGDEASARALLAAREAELQAIYGDKIFGYDNDILEAVVGRLLTERGATVSTAESCTGGLLASRITDIAGASAYFMGGGIVYNADAKMFLAGVDPAAIQEHGEVSEAVAIELASGIRRRFHTTYGIGITGIAGPGGGSEAKPVGTVHLAVATARSVEHRKLFWPASREIIKRFSTQAALDLLRLSILRGM